MSARYVFKVGPANRNSDYAHRITVLADTYNESKSKAIVFRGLRPADSKVWLISIDEFVTDMEVLEQLAKLIREEKSNE